MPFQALMIQDRATFQSTHGDSQTRPRTFPTWRLVCPRWFWSCAWPSHHPESQLHRPEHGFSHTGELCHEAGPFSRRYGTWFACARRPGGWRRRGWGLFSRFQATSCLLRASGWPQWGLNPFFNGFGLGRNCFWDFRCPNRTRSSTLNVQRSFTWLVASGAIVCAVFSFTGIFPISLPFSSPLGPSVEGYGVWVPVLQSSGQLAFVLGPWDWIPLHKVIRTFPHPWLPPSLSRQLEKTQIWRLLSSPEVAHQTGLI